jgi:hypothetical protein
LDELKKRKKRYRWEDNWRVRVLYASRSNFRTAHRGGFLYFTGAMAGR